ncbi:MAG: hypothetical protein IJW16_00550 [Clostridia bacterium]|nr:hypothetical protein [Clostridia bacterium]
MKNSKKQLIAIIAFIVTSVILFSAQTIAYFTDGGDNNTVITMVGANLSGELIEATVTEEGAEPVIGPTAVRIVPGKAVEKSVAVKNTGDLGMYLRLTVEKEFALSAENAGKPTDPTLVQFELNTTHWEERDGFYYYKTPVLSGETTEPLFTEVNFSSQMDNTYTNSTITFRIKAYATQTVDNSASVFEAHGWPAVQ